MVNVLKELGSHLECTEKKRVFLIKRQNVNSINGANEKKYFNGGEHEKRFLIMFYVPY